MMYINKIVTFIKKSVLICPYCGVWLSNGVFRNFNGIFNPQTFFDQWSKGRIIKCTRCKNRMLIKTNRTVETILDIMVIGMFFSMFLGSPQSMYFKVVFALIVIGCITYTTCTTKIVKLKK